MEEIDELFNDFLRRYADEFVKELRYALVFETYPYGQGYNLSRSSQGEANKFAGVGYGYPSSLAASIEPVFNFDDFEVDFLMNAYWYYVNNGRKPGGSKLPPIEPLKLWAQKRLGLSGDEAKGAAFGIARNIYKFGIQPSYFYDRAVAALEETFEANQEQIAESVNDFIEQTTLKSIPPNNEITIGL